MPRAKTETSGHAKCHGGLSDGCRHDEHPIGKTPDVLCCECHARMGCSSCVQISRELFCLRCKRWATKVALEHHGPVMGLSEIQAEIKELLDDIPF